MSAMINTRQISFPLLKDLDLSDTACNTVHVYLRPPVSNSIHPKRIVLDDDAFTQTIPIFKKTVASVLLDHFSNSDMSIIVEDELDLDKAYSILVIIAISLNLQVELTSKASETLSFLLSDSISSMQTLANLKAQFCDEWKSAVSNPSNATFIDRLTASIKRDLDYNTRQNQAKIDESKPPYQPCYTKPLPSLGAGLAVFEWFSGIGGMRLALPRTVKGIPITSITAIDCSDTVNDIYEHNFHSSGGDGERLDGVASSKLLRLLIARGSVKLEDVDGKADIWTMSPPCQPYTKTRGSLSRDAQDNRSKGLYHIIHLLTHMTIRPRYIVLENVAGFYGSNMLGYWKSALKMCGYVWREWMLSPTDLGVPNERKRYYMSCECILPEPLHRRADMDQRILSLPFIDNELHTELPEHLRISSDGTALSQRSLAEYLSTLPVAEKNALQVPLKILQSKWAPTRLGLSSKSDVRSYCFTKGYGRIYDKSSGTLLLEEGSAGDVDRNDLAALHGKIRLFSPNELLLLFGFPAAYTFPPHVTLSHKFAAVGNSVNIEVVRRVMLTLFE